MSNFFKAEEVFKELPEDVKKEVFKIAEGKVVYFPKQNNNRKNVDRLEICENYACGDSYSKIGDQLGLSKMRICQIVNQERQGYSKKRIEYWKKQGLSLREIARLYKRSHENIRQQI